MDSAFEARRKALACSCSRSSEALPGTTSTEWDVVIIAEPGSTASCTCVSIAFTRGKLLGSLLAASLLYGAFYPPAPRECILLRYQKTTCQLGLVREREPITVRRVRPVLDS